MPHEHIDHPFYKGQWLPVAFGSAVVSTVPKMLATDFGFSDENLTEAKRAVISTHGGRCHVRWDGGSPTPTEGIMLFGDTSRPMIISGQCNVILLQFIREMIGPDAIVSIMIEK